MRKLKGLPPCPFCGSAAVVTKDGYIMCSNFEDCGLNSGLCKAFELEAWTRRTPVIEQRIDDIKTSSDS